MHGGYGIFLIHLMVSCKIKLFNVVSLKLISTHSGGVDDWAVMSDSWQCEVKRGKFLNNLNDACEYDPRTYLCRKCEKHGNGCQSELHLEMS